jgi:hypothetical protein
MEIDMTASNMTLADRAALAKDVLDAAQRQFDAIKAEIKATAHDGIIEGEFATVTITYTTPERFDAKVAKAFLTTEQVAACTKPGSLVETIRIKNKIAVAA